MMRAGKTAVLFAVLFVLAVSPTASFRVGPACAEDGPDPAAPKGEQRLAGRWVRPDGGYVLELKKVRKDGTLEAAYYNPGRIRVARAEWKKVQGAESVLIELRDINYPGSKYDLRYDPKSDRLKGTYFQAVERNTYEVEFERQ